MRIKYIGAVAILASGVAMAQTQPAETPAPNATPPEMSAPGPTPDGTSTAEAQQQTPPPKQHALSGCQKAIHASEKALKNSQASPDTIARAWQHIANAKQEKGAACKEEAKQAQEML